MKYHALADLFPRMNVAEFGEFVADVKAHGVREPVLTYKGEIIDGRHRWEAAQQAGVKCPIVEWDGKGSLVALVLSRNSHRRHLTPSQRAAVAAEVVPLLQQEAEQRRLAGNARGGQSSARVRSTSENGGKNADLAIKPYRGKAAAEAARAMGVGTRTVEQVRRLPQEAREQVKAGTVSARAAAKQYRPAPKKTGTPAKLDRFGREIPRADIAAALLDDVEGFNRAMNLISQAKGEVTKLIEIPAGVLLNQQQIEADLSNARRLIRFAKPHAVCVYCRGADPKCAACRGRGWIGEGVYDDAPADLKGEKPST